MRHYLIIAMFIASIALSVAAVFRHFPALPGDAPDLNVRASQLAESSIPSLITEPDDGLDQLKTELQSAKKTIDVVMYEFADAVIEQILADKAAQQVAVRVILDRNRSMKWNQDCFNFLSAHGVQVAWAPAEYAATHQKSVSIDGEKTFIMTLNLDSHFYATARDFAVTDTNADDNAAIAQVFDADFNGRPITPPLTPILTWSPTQSENAILNFINSAQRTLAIENEEMAYADIVDALGKAAGRGVQVKTIMTLEKEWAENFEKLARAGAQIAVYEPNAALYIHAKVILADYGTAGQKLFIGSQNFSVESLDKNRELGLTTTTPAVLASVNATLTKDFNAGRRWQLMPPKP